MGELLGRDPHVLLLQSGATVDDVWRALVERAPEVASLRASTRVAINAIIATEMQALHDGDELAFLPPVGGG